MAYESSVNFDGRYCDCECSATRAATKNTIQNHVVLGTWDGNHMRHCGHTVAIGIVNAREREWQREHSTKMETKQNWRKNSQKQWPKTYIRNTVKMACDSRSSYIALSSKFDCGKNVLAMRVGKQQNANHCVNSRTHTHTHRDTQRQTRNNQMKKSIRNNSMFTLRYFEGERCFCSQSTESATATSRLCIFGGFRFFFFAFWLIRVCAFCICSCLFCFWPKVPGLRIEQESTSEQTRYVWVLPVIYIYMDATPRQHTHHSLCQWGIFYLGCRIILLLLLSIVACGRYAW